MRMYVVLRYVGFILLVNASLMVVSLLAAIYYGDQGLIPLLFSALITAFVGIFPIVFIPRVSRISNKEGYLIVMLSWLTVCLFGTLPYVLYGGEFDLSGAWFEAVSGYTTTGATILNDVEALPQSLMLWRSLTHWFGGVGVVVFALVILPNMGGAQMALSRNEMSTIARQDFRYRSRTMVRIMTSVYLGLTLLTFSGLYVAGIPAFDAANLSLSTVATGGFAITNLSIAAYQNVQAEMWIVLMMFLSSIHFGLLFATISGRFRALLQAPALRFFTGLVGAVMVLITLNLHLSDGQSWLGALRLASFQVMSIVSTTGFATCNASVWPAFSLLLLLLLNLVGGCSGSTAGGMKSDRILIMFKSFKTFIIRQQHPQAVIPVSVGRFQLRNRDVSNTLLYLLMFLCVILLSSLLLALTGLNLGLSLSASASCMANVGPSIGAMGLFDSYALLTPTARLILSVVMLLGRLELFGLLLIFSKNSWS